MTSYTTVEIGRAFEKHCLRFLNHHLNMSLRRVGGAGDEGIDLKGWWYVPSNARRRETSMKSPSRALEDGQEEAAGGEGEASVVEESPTEWTAGFADDLAPVDVPRRLTVVGQCKAERAKVNARPVRELEGVMGHIHGR